MVKSRLIKLGLGLGLLLGAGVLYTQRQNSDSTNSPALAVEKTPLAAATEFFAQLENESGGVLSGLVFPIKASLSMANDRKGWCETEESEIKTISTQEDLKDSMVFIKRAAKNIENREVVASEKDTFGIYGNGPCEEPNIKLQFSSSGMLADIQVTE